MEIIRAQDVRRGNIATDDTMTTRRGMKVESQLTNSLVEIVGAIIERVSKAPDNFNLTTSVRQDFELRIKDILRAGIETLYNLGATYTNNANNSVGFTTQTDIENIKRLTDEALEVFFGRVVGYIVRERERSLTRFLMDVRLPLIIPGRESFKVKQPLQLEKQIANVVTSIATRAINGGTISKTRQLLGSAGGGLLITRKASLSDYELDLLESAGSQLSEGTQYELGLAKEVNRARAAEILTEKEFIKPWLSYRLKEISPMVIFVTAADDKVCFHVCRPLEGETFNINEGATPIPPDETHPNCRCRLLNMDESGNILLDTDDSKEIEPDVKEIEQARAEQMKEDECIRAGTCIPSSYQDLTTRFKQEAINDQAQIVHGWIYSDVEKRDIKHAWIEFESEDKKNKVWEPVTQQFYEKEFLQSKYNLKPVKRYSYLDIFKLSMKTQSRGGEFEF